MLYVENAALLQLANEKCVRAKYSPKFSRIYCTAQNSKQSLNV
jgi:hypothetical protein